MGNQDVGTLLLLGEHDVSRVTDLSVKTLRKWRHLGRGPRFIKVGRAVRYLPADVAAWLDSRPSGGESLSRDEREPEAVHA